MWLESSPEAPASFGLERKEEKTVSVAASGVVTGDDRGHSRQCRRLHRAPRPVSDESQKPPAMISFQLKPEACSDRSSPCGRRA